jgi:hypothetical protein
LKSELGRIQAEIVNNPGNQDLRDEELSYISAVRSACKEEELWLKQRAKIEWLAVGDQNTAYFHKAIKGLQSRGE